jgi:hypothetical protein
MTTEQIQKKKLKKSYAQLLEEAKGIMSKTAAVYIPELCEALKSEQPELSNTEIKQQIELDLEGIWKPTTILTSLPSWIHDQKKVQASKLGWERQNTRKVIAAKKIIADLEKINLPEANIKQPDRTEEVDQEMHELGIAKFGDSDKSIRELKGRIYQSATDLFEALTDKETPPDESDDLIVDYIKPTREFRRSLILELDEGDRTLIHNKLHYASVAIEDMIKIISEVKDK